MQSYSNFDLWMVLYNISFWGRSKILLNVKIGFFLWKKQARVLCNQIYIKAQKYDVDDI